MMVSTLATTDAAPTTRQHPRWTRASSNAAADRQLGIRYHPGLDDDRRTAPAMDLPQWHHRQRQAFAPICTRRA